MLNRPSIHAISITYATPADAEDIAHIHHAAWQESYKGIIDQSYLNALCYDDFFARRRWILSFTKTDSIHLVAKCPQSVGFCDAGISRTHGHKGEIYAIYVLDAYKQQGIGRMLMCKASKYFAQNDLFPFIVWVLADNKPVRCFYEKLGGVAVQEKIEKMGDRDYIEIGYLFKEPPSIVI